METRGVIVLCGLPILFVRGRKREGEGWYMGPLFSADRRRFLAKGQEIYTTMPLGGHWSGSNGIEKNLLAKCFGLRLHSACSRIFWYFFGRHLLWRIQSRKNSLFYFFFFCFGGAFDAKRKEEEERKRTKKKPSLKNLSWPMAKNFFSPDMDLPLKKRLCLDFFWVAFIFCIFLRNLVNLSPKRKTKKDALLHIALF